MNMEVLPTAAVSKLPSTFRHKADLYGPVRVHLEIEPCGRYCLPTFFWLLKAPPLPQLYLFHSPALYRTNSHVPQKDERPPLGINHRREMLRCNWISISTVTPVGSSVDALYQKLYTQSKSAPEVGRICRPKHVGLSSISTAASVGSSVGALYQKLYTQSKIAPEDGRICSPKHVGLN